MNYLVDDFLLFLIYSFIGWVCEVIYCSIPAKKFVNRGFLVGPYCPIYGFGALAVINILMPFSDNPVIVYFFAVIITSIIEYATGYLLERVYHLKWWDYSNYKWNIHGRVVLHNSIIFGVLSVLAIYHLNPVLIGMVNKFSLSMRTTVSLMLLFLFLIDNIISTLNALKLKNNLSRLHLISDEIKQKVSEKLFIKSQSIPSENEQSKIRVLSHKIDELNFKFNDISKQNKKFVKRVFAAFPNMSSKLHKEILSNLKALNKMNTKKKNKKTKAHG